VQIIHIIPRLHNSGAKVDIAAGYLKCAQKDIFGRIEHMNDLLFHQLSSFRDIIRHLLGDMSGYEDYLSIFLGQDILDEPGKGLYQQQKDGSAGDIEYQMGIGHLLSLRPSQAVDEPGKGIQKRQKYQHSQEIEEELGHSSASRRSIHPKGYHQPG